MTAPVDPDGRRQSIALLLMAPAPFVFGSRALMSVAGWGDVPGLLFAVVGILGSAGMLTLLVATWKTPDFAKVAVAVAIAVAGHYVVDRLVDGGLGSAMVYLGTGFAGSLRQPLAQYAGVVAGVGAMLRTAPDLDPAVGNSVLFLGAWALCGMLVRGAMAPTNPKSSA